ncbi:Asp/Glu racemase [Octadecabacter sp. R77987]|uniref:maleate cis-trans isomerase family protein n=1 Tax=Octadecabacter sp. R77987 TaxID=3093874 RepID=UPI00366DCC45
MGQVFDYDLGARISPALGLILLQPDETLEHEIRSVLGTDVTLHCTRVPSAPTLSRESLALMENQLPAAAALLPDTAFSVIGYGCTSGTSVIGAAKVADMVQSGRRAAGVTDPLTALIAACKHLELQNIALLTPYVIDVSQGLRDVLSDAGVATPVFGSFNEAEEARVARIDAASLIHAATTLGQSPDVDAVFLSCTNLRTLDILRQIGGAIGKPALSSNQVLIWHMAQLAGIKVDLARFGPAL